MELISTFDINKEALLDLLRGIQQGKIQLPDFQRDFVWNAERISRLLCSVSLAYPIGAFTTFQLNNSQLRFKPRSLQGIEIELGTSPTLLILDGQQRLTSLYQALFCQQPVTTKSRNGHKLDRRWYYIDIQKALQFPTTDRAEAILSLSESRMLRDYGNIVLDLSTAEGEFTADIFPLSQIFNYSNWRSQYSRFWEREDWEVRERRFQQQPLLKEVKGGDFLQAVCLISTYFRRIKHIVEAATHIREQLPVIGCTGKEMLNLSQTEYQQWADVVTAGFEDVARLLHAHKMFDAADLPYPMQVVTLVAICTVLKERMNTDKVRGQLMQWFWCGALCESFLGSRAPRAARDLIETTEWVNGGSVPMTIQNALFAESRLLSLRNRRGAIFKAVAALLRGEGVLDFITGEAITDTKYFQEQVDVHHIFPQAWCQKEKIESKLYNCFVNKTPLSMRTNRMLGSMAPSRYLQKLEEMGTSRERLERILRSHLIEPEYLRNDDFEGFFRSRQQALMTMIFQAMGKSPSS
jgi:hypothetical protein